jgi:tripartite-type tricarboxylate transporter receptor subunit TctC
MIPVPLKKTFRLLGLAWLAACAGLALAQEAAFPTRPITLIVPFPAGGPSDVLARAVADRMGANLHQPVIIDNAAGASGTIGLAKLTHAPKDGYTLGFGTIGTHVANVAVFKRLPYDPVADFEPVGMAGSAPMILLVRNDLPVRNLPEFVKYLQANKGKVSYGSAGVGSVGHFGCVMLLAGIRQTATHIPYRGVSPAMVDLQGGRLDFMCDQTTAALPQLASGRIRAIAVLSDRGIAQLPGVQTARSSGYADVSLRSWNAIFAPKGTPPAVVKRLTQALAAAVADPGLRKSMSEVGLELPSSETVSPGIVTSFITLGLKRDVPALKAHGEYLD